MVPSDYNCPFLKLLLAVKHLFLFPNSKICESTKNPGFIWGRPKIFLMNAEEFFQKSNWLFSKKMIIFQLPCHDNGKIITLAQWSDSNPKHPEPKYLMSQNMQGPKTQNWNNCSIKNIDATKVAHGLQATRRPELQQSNSCARRRHFCNCWTVPAKLLSPQNGTTSGWDTNICSQSFAEKHTQRKDGCSGNLETFETVLARTWRNT